jgi:hypothetical protein
VCYCITAGARAHNFQIDKRKRLFFMCACKKYRTGTLHAVRLPKRKRVYKYFVLKSHAQTELADSSISRYYRFRYCTVFLGENELYTAVQEERREGDMIFSV